MTEWKTGDPVRLREGAETFRVLSDRRRLRGVFVAFDEEPDVAVVEFEGWLGKQRVFVRDLEHDTSMEPREVLTHEQRCMVAALAEALGQALDVSATTGTVPTVAIDQIEAVVKQRN